LTWSDM